MQRVILVTGGNRGIGFEICRQLGRLGNDVILTARDEEKGCYAMAKLQAEGYSIFFQRLDLTRMDELLGQLVDFVKSRFGRLDGLINNAGIIGSSHGSGTVESSELHQVMETNFFGHVKLTQAMLPLLAKSEDARIVNLSTGMAVMSDLGGGYAAYRISKVAINAFTLNLAHDSVRQNIKVNAVCPGWVRTDMGSKNAPRSIEKGAETPVWLACEDGVGNGRFYRDKKIISW